MTILSATVMTMMSICDIFMKTLSVGITTNYTQRNKWYELCPKPLLNKCETGDKTEKSYLKEKKFVF